MAEARSATGAEAGPGPAPAPAAPSLSGEALASALLLVSTLVGTVGLAGLLAALWRALG